MSREMKAPVVYYVLLCDSESTIDIPIKLPYPASSLHLHHQQAQNSDTQNGLRHSTFYSHLPRQPRRVPIRRVPCQSRGRHWSRWKHLSRSMISQENEDHKLKMRRDGCIQGEEY